jgi:hypothetical protein
LDDKSAFRSCGACLLLCGDGNHPKNRSVDGEHSRSVSTKGRRNFVGRADLIVHNSETLFSVGGYMGASMRQCGWVLVLLFLLGLLLPVREMAAADVPSDTPAGRTRTYYIAAEEID